MNRLLVCVVLVLSGRAAADSSVASAFSAGLTAYGKGDFATAIVAFEAAFRIDASAEVAFTLAQSHRNQYFIDKDVTHLHRALGLYRHYLAEAPKGRRAPHARLHLDTIEAILASIPTPAPAQVVDRVQPTQLLVTSEAPGARASIDGGASAAIPYVVEVAAGSHRIRVEAKGYDSIELDALAVAERLVVVPAALRAQPAQLIVNTDDSAQITVDGTVVEPVTKLAAGTHRLAIVARGRQPVVRTIELAAGETATVDVALVPTTRRRAARWTLYGAGGLGGAALITGGIAWLAQREALALHEDHSTSAEIDEYKEAVARRDTWRTVSIGLATSASIAALTGAALWYFDAPRAAEHSSTVVPTVSPESVGATWVGRF